MEMRINDPDPKTGEGEVWVKGENIMTDTIISSATKEVVIGFERPFAIIGERINPTGRKKMQAALVEGDFEMVRQDAIAQVSAGAAI